MNSQQIILDAKIAALVLVHTDIGQGWKQGNTCTHSTVIKVFPVLVPVLFKDFLNHWLCFYSGASFD